MRGSSSKRSLKGEVRRTSEGARDASGRRAGTFALITHIARPAGAVAPTLSLLCLHSSLKSNLSLNYRYIT